MKRGKELVILGLFILLISSSLVFAYDTGSVTFSSVNAPLYNPPRHSDPNYQCIDGQGSWTSSENTGAYPMQISSNSKFSAGEKLKIKNPSGKVCDRVSYPGCWCKACGCRNCGTSCEGGTLYDYTSSKIKVGFYSSNAMSAGNRPIAEYSLSSFVGDGIAIPSGTKYIFVAFLEPSDYGDNSLGVKMTFNYEIGTACTPLTTASCSSVYPGQCGSLSNNCGGTINCECSSGTCSNGQCTQTHSCTNSNQTIIKLYDWHNSPGALWNDTTYGYSICSPTEYPKDIHNCNENNSAILWLNSSDSAYASIDNTSKYNVPVCFGNLTCRAVKEDSLKGYYPLDGNANDASGNSNNGIVSGATLAAGKIGQAYSFDGTNDGITIANTDQLSITGNMSFGMWIYLTAYPSNSWKAMLAKIYDDDNGEFSFRIYNNTAGQIYYGNGTDDVTWQGVNLLSFNPSQDIPLNQWVYVAGVRTGTNLTIYSNGVKKESVIVSSGAIKTNSNITIGYQKYLNGGPTYYFNGMIDEVKIWNRSISDNEVLNEYQGGSLCSSDEKLTLRLSGETDALISNASDSNFPLQICCKEKDVSPPMFSNITWQDMLGNNITTADVNDTVKMVVFRQDLLLKNVNYQVFKERTCSLSDPLDCVLQFFGDVRIAQEQSRGYRTIRINETGNYYFTAKAEDSTDVATSNTLAITSPQVNNVPVISIVKPIEESRFVVWNNGKTDTISFEQNATDTDDDLSVTWDFNDGYTIKKENCLTGGNCNATYSYNSSAAGTRMITAEAKESTRYNPQSEYDIKRIYVYKPGLVLFPIIDSPDYRIKVFNPGTVRFDGTSTHVANCTYSLSECNLPGKGSGSCFTINNGPNISCYKFAESATDSGFIFEWTIDGDVDTDHTTPAPFERLFPYGGRHNINLKVTYTY